MLINKYALGNIDIIFQNKTINYIWFIIFFHEMGGDLNYSVNSNHVKYLLCFPQKIKVIYYFFGIFLLHNTFIQKFIFLSQFFFIFLILGWLLVLQKMIVNKLKSESKKLELSIDVKLKCRFAVIKFLSTRQVKILKSLQTKILLCKNIHPQGSILWR